jgi:hypothetical protein
MSPAAALARQQQLAYAEREAAEERARQAAAAEAAGIDLMSCSFDSPEAQAELQRLVDERTAALATAHRQLLDTQFAMESVGIGIEWLDFDSLRFVYVNSKAASTFVNVYTHRVRIQDSTVAPNFNWIFVYTPCPVKQFSFKPFNHIV